MQVDFNSVELIVTSVKAYKFLVYLADKLFNTKINNFSQFYDVLWSINIDKNIQKSYKLSNSEVLNYANAYFNKRFDTLRIIIDSEKILVQDVNAFYDFLIKFDNDEFFYNFMDVVNDF